LVSVTNYKGRQKSERERWGESLWLGKCALGGGGENMRLKESEWEKEKMEEKKNAGCRRMSSTRKRASLRLKSPKLLKTKVTTFSQANLGGGGRWCTCRRETGNKVGFGPRENVVWELPRKMENFRGPGVDPKRVKTGAFVSS